MQSVKLALKEAQAQLHKISDAPDLDAERLMLHVLDQKESAGLYAHGEETLTLPQQIEFEKVVALRAMGKPLAYILGEWEFYGRPYFVNKNVLVPRPETEHLVTEVLGFCQSFLRKQESRQTPFVIVDIGTGSGCIAITLALELQTPSHSPLSGGEPLSFSLPDKGGRGWVSIIATDISPTALEVAKRNAKRHRVDHLIDFRVGNMFEPLKNDKVDLIVSNPPYVPAQELDRPEPPRNHVGFGAARRIQGKIETVGLDFEPRLALDGGPDGLVFVREIKKTAKRLGIPAVIEMTQGKVHMFA